MSLDVVQTLSEMIAIPSVNPMGYPESGPEYFEGRMTAYLQRLFEHLDVPFVKQEVEPGRENIVARLDGDSRGGRSSVLMFEAHQDTVPVKGMTIEPFTPRIRDGRIYGRGACDIKGGLAAMLTAFSRLVAERPADMPTLIMACTVNEEHGFTGASALTPLWREGKFISRQPDAAVVAEPTMLDVVVAHKGVVRWRLHAKGRAAHSSQPELGDNAIFRMARVLAALEEYQKSVVPDLAFHPLCGKPSLSVGTIEGGMSVNTVPARATIQIDRRLVPGENPEDAYRHVIEFVFERIGPEREQIENDRPFLIGPGLSDKENGTLAKSLIASAQGIAERSSAIGVPFGTNAAATSAAGVPSVVFGPGSIDQAHTADEWLDLDQLHKATEILYRFGRTGVAQG